MACVKREKGGGKEKLVEEKAGIGCGKGRKREKNVEVLAVLSRELGVVVPNI